MAYLFVEDEQSPDTHAIVSGNLLFHNGVHYEVVQHNGCCRLLKKYGEIPAINGGEVIRGALFQLNSEAGIYVVVNDEEHNMFDEKWTELVDEELWMFTVVTVIKKISGQSVKERTTSIRNIEKKM